MRGLAVTAEKPSARPASRGPLVALTLAAALLLPASAFAVVTATVVEGKVLIRSSGSSIWGEMGANQVVNPGDEIKTARGAKVTLTFQDGSRVEVGPNGSFILEDASPSSAGMRFNVGRMKAFVNKLMARRFAVRTPTAVCSVRGTGFDVDVSPGGQTSVSVFEGLVGVGDQKGNEVLLNEGQKIEVTASGLGTVQTSEAQAEKDEKQRQGYKREVALDMTKEEIQAAAALEQKNAVYQQGKAMIDVNGNRVRLEEYIIVPRSNQFKLVVLNERADRFDYFYYLGTFNKNLPADLPTAFRQVPGCIGAACEFFMTGFEIGRSNTSDHMLERASGGHLVDVNNNGVAGDEVTAAFNVATNDFAQLSVLATDNAANKAAPANTKFFKTLFDNYAMLLGQTGNLTPYITWAPDLTKTPNGIAYSPALAACVAAGGLGDACGGIQSMGHSTTGAGDQRTLDAAVPALGVAAPPKVINIVKSPNCETLDNCTGFRDEGKFHDIQYLQSADSTVFLKFDNYIIDDGGKVASFSDFAGITSGADLKATLLKWNYQQIITATAFGNRKIDLVFEPKILIESGLIP